MCRHVTVTVPTLWQILDSDPELSTLKAAVEAAGLVFIGPLLLPERRLYNVKQTMTTEAAIRTAFSASACRATASSSPTRRAAAAPDRIWCPFEA